MATHLWERKTVTVRTRTLLINLCKFAQRIGYTKDQAARYAVQFYERSQQGTDRPSLLCFRYFPGYAFFLQESELQKDKPNWDKVFYGLAPDPFGKHFYKPVKLKALQDYLRKNSTLIAYQPNNLWYKGASVHCNELIYYRHTGKPKPNDDGGANLALIVERLKGYAAAHPNADRSDDFKRVLAIYKQVSNVLPSLEYLRASLLTLNPSMARFQRNWSNITRGEDLFIKGLGGFDINKTCQRALKLRRRGHNITEPREFTTLGYIDKLGMLQPGDRLKNLMHQAERVFFNRFRLPHFIQHRAFWVGHEHFDLLAYANNDELNLDPRQLIANALNAEEAKGKPRYPDTQPLPFNCEPLTLSNGWSLKPPSTVGELRQAAVKLKNCAAGYVKAVTEQDTAIIVAYKGEKPVAMAELDPIGGNYRQLVGPCNKQLPPEVRQLVQPTSSYFKQQFHN